MFCNRKSFVILCIVIPPFLVGLFCIARFPIFRVVFISPFVLRSPRGFYLSFSFLSHMAERADPPQDKSRARTRITTRRGPRERGLNTCEGPVNYVTAIFILCHLFPSSNPSRCSKIPSNLSTPSEMTFAASSQWGWDKRPDDAMEDLLSLSQPGASSRRKPTGRLRETRNTTLTLSRGIELNLCPPGDSTCNESRPHFLPLPLLLSKNECLDDPVEGDRKLVFFREVYRRLSRGFVPGP